MHRHDLEFGKVAQSAPITVPVVEAVDGGRQPVKEPDEHHQSAAADQPLGRFDGRGLMGDGP